MKKNKLTLTIGIPAYNEEKTIIDCIKAIKSQQKSHYKLDRLAVYSDGSTDNTTKLVKANFKDVIVYDFKNNRGQGARINQILKNNKSDIVFTIDSDIKFNDKNVFDRIVNKFENNPNLGIVCAYHKAKKPKAFIGKISYFSYRVWDRARNSVGKRGIRYYCEGGLLAYSKSFASEFKIPQGRHVPADAYTFYFAVSRGFKVEVCKSAKVYMDLPEKYADYVKQMKRHVKDLCLAHEGFSTEYSDKYEVLTIKTKFAAFVVEYFKTPIVGIAYAFVQSWVRLSVLFYKPPKSWVPIERK